MARAAPLFQTVSKRDPLGFWAGETLDARKVAGFLSFDKADVAKVAGVATASVRFDRKIPIEVRERFEQIANIIGLVAQFFEDDPTKTALWFRTKNPLLGQVSPRDLIRIGRYGTLRRFVMEALMESPGISAAALTGPPHAQTTDARELAVRTGVDHPVIARHRREIGRLCEQYGVRRLALFGSILRSDFDATASDVDFVVEFARIRGSSLARQYFDFKADLEGLLGRPVDLVELKALPDSRLKRIIERTRVPVYGEAA